ncbi:MAG: hypothetical protein D6718_02140 [Acidobacteria bacterium]|nr:MAG: hypothetical protein D6718_02140 [Acidobacteriota bacterium]
MRIRAAVLTSIAAVLAAPAAFAGHADRVAWRTRSLAYRLDSATAVLLHDAERYARHGAIADEIVLERLWEFKRATREFRLEARRAARIDRLRHEFLELLPAYERAGYALFRFNRSGHVARRFDRVRHLVAELESTLQVRYAARRFGRTGSCEIAGARSGWRLRPWPFPPWAW